jgi:hypothetical protein
MPILKMIKKLKFLSYKQLENNKKGKEYRRGITEV